MWRADRVTLLQKWSGSIQRLAGWFGVQKGYMVTICNDIAVSFGMSRFTSNLQTQTKIKHMNICSPFVDTRNHKAIILPWELRFSYIRNIYIWNPMEFSWIPSRWTLCICIWWTWKPSVPPSNNWITRTAHWTQSSRRGCWGWTEPKDPLELEFWVVLFCICSCIISLYMFFRHISLWVFMYIHTRGIYIYIFMG